MHFSERADFCLDTVAPTPEYARLELTIIRRIETYTLDTSPVAWQHDIFCVDGGIDHAHIKMMSAAVYANGGKVH